MNNCLHIIAPRDKRLVWYLSTEEYLAQHILDTTVSASISASSAHALPQDGGIFFTWVVPPTVIFGRHQVMADEVNVAYCQSHGVQMYRRKSGGGCVYSDKGNLMLSYITPNTHSEQVFQFYLDSVTDSLHQMGFEAVKSEHNDVLIDGRKVSGNACYALPTGTIVHGTMLYNVDFDALQQAITPTHEKLSKHGVQSVRQRVANLVELPNGSSIPSVEALSDSFVTSFCSSSRLLTSEEIAAIDVLEKNYLDPIFIEGK